MSARAVNLGGAWVHARAREQPMKVAPVILSALLAVAVVYRRSQLSDLARMLAAIVILGLLAYGSGLVHPPSHEIVIRDVARTLGPYTYALVGVLAFLETGAGIGLVAPGELALILGGVSAGQGEIELIPLIAIVWACALAGDLTSFILGRRLGREFLVRHGPKVGITHQRLEQVERFFAAHGGKTIFIGRFVGLVRPLSPFIAGASTMSARRFIPYTTLAAGIWATTFSVLGYLFWHSLDQLIAITKQGTFALAALIVLAAGTIALHRHLRVRSRHRPSERACPDRSPRPPSWNDGQAQ
jgi:membrane protein DedA with SNARE-associated domain